MEQFKKLLLINILFYYNNKIFKILKRNDVYDILFIDPIIF